MYKNISKRQKYNVVDFFIITFFFNFGLKLFQKIKKKIKNVKTNKTWITDENDSIDLKSKLFQRKKMPHKQYYLGSEKENKIVLKNNTD